MKKSLIGLMAMMMVVLSGCGSSSSEAEVPANRLEQIKADGKIVMATSPDYAPYEFEDLRKEGQDSIVGADIELGKYIAEQLGVELFIETMDFNSVVASITQGKADMAISGLAYKEDRAEAMELSQGYNLSSDGYQGFLVPASEVDNYKTLADFKGKVLATQNGSLQHELALAQVGEFVEEPITSLNDGVMMLMTNKVDVLVISSSTGEQYSENYPELVMSDVQLEYTSSGTVIGMEKGETELLEAINAIIDDVIEQDLYTQWVAESEVLADEIGLGD